MMIDDECLHDFDIIMLITIDILIHSSLFSSSANHCDYSGRRLCTAAEVCPSSPGGQSVAGVIGGSLTKAVLVVGDTFVDAATCQRLSQISSYTVDGFLCCPTGDLPSPKDFVSDGE